MAKGLRERLVGLVTGATPAHAGPTIAVAHLSLRRGASEVLRDVSFTMERTGVLVILGPNGAGKTSLLETLAGLRRDHTGSVELFGEPWRARDHRRRLGVVLQREGIPDLVTVSEYASLFAALYDVPGRARWIVAQAALEARRDVAVEKLSGGEAQRLFLAAATVHDPSLCCSTSPRRTSTPSRAVRWASGCARWPRRARWCSRRTTSPRPTRWPIGRSFWWAVRSVARGRGRRFWRPFRPRRGARGASRTRSFTSAAPR